MTATDSSGSSWSNIPRCLNTVQTTSMLSSDAGISSMPSSMISNISETEHHTLTNYNSQQQYFGERLVNFPETLEYRVPKLLSSETDYQRNFQSVYTLPSLKKVRCSLQLLLSLNLFLL